jgi:hypothetical protein
VNDVLLSLGRARRKLGDGSASDGVRASATPLASTLQIDGLRFGGGDGAQVKRMFACRELIESSAMKTLLNVSAAGCTWIEPPQDGHVVPTRVPTTLTAETTTTLVNDSDLATESDSSHMDMSCRLSSADALPILIAARR